MSPKHVGGQAQMIDIVATAFACVDHSISLNATLIKRWQQLAILQGVVYITYACGVTIHSIHCHQLDS